MSSFPYAPSCRFPLGSTYPRSGSAMGRSDRPPRKARAPDMDATPASSRQLGRVPRAERDLSSVMPPLAALRPAASAARAHVRATLAMWEISHLADAAEAVVSELVANAVN